MKRIIFVALAALMLLPASAQKSPEEKMSMTMYAITNMYVDSVPKGPFVDKVIALTAKLLDPFSAYLTPEEARANENALLDGKTSAGINFMQHGQSTIRYAYMLDKKTGYIAISMFSETTAQDFRTAVASLKKQGMKQLVLDLQGNPGGFFDTAVELADELLSGDKTIVTTRGAHIPTETRKASHTGCFEKGRLVVMTDGRTMSAAEILTAALRDWDRATIIGMPTYGKGLIQQTMPFSDGSALRITVARYFTPCGMSIQTSYPGWTNPDSLQTWKSLATGRTLKWGHGIQPDITAENDVSFQTNWYYCISMAGLQKAVAAKYAKELGKQLKATYKTPAQYLQRFDDEEQLLAAVRKTAEEAGVPFVQEEYDKAKTSVFTQLKALIGREIYPDDATIYYKVLNTRNNVLQVAMKSLQ